MATGSDPSLRVPVERGPNGRLRRVRPSDALDPDVVDLLHKLVLDHGTYEAMLRYRRLSQPAESALDFVDAYLADMAPRNAVERMLAIQMLWQHARIAQLSVHAAANAERADARGLHLALDSALNTYRRQALAWQELRSPRPVQVFKGEQVNVAHQQVVSNAPAAALPRPAAEPAALLNEPDEQANAILGGWSRRAAPVDPATPTLDAEHRTPILRRQGSVEP